MSKHTFLHGLFFALSLTYAWMMLSVYVLNGSESLAGVVVQQPTQTQWVTIEENQTDSGSTIPAGKNVVFHLPKDITSIERLVLFGKDSKKLKIRYWGFCYPGPNDRATAPSGSRLPGKVFLSEGERAWRAKRQNDKLPLYTLYRPPRKAELENKSQPVIRHELEVFRPGATCYIMTEKPLPIGTDRDNDQVNAMLEHQLGIDPNEADTDDDGLNDGIELFEGTDPIRRDSDGDGLIDGLEDANQNGRQDIGETSALAKDTDKDNLCDGFCTVLDSKRICPIDDLQATSCIDLQYGRYTGEDKNLNGTVDSGETDPRKRDSDGDGTSDEINYYNCIFAGGTDC